MTAPRPVLRLRLRGSEVRDGEIPLDDLVAVAQETQAVVRRIAQGMVGQRRPGRPTTAVEEATTLSLIGLHKGSTVLEIAGAASPEDTLGLGDLPLDLGERSIAMFIEAAEALTRDIPQLPLGFDSAAAEDLDRWLRRATKYEGVGLEGEIRGRRFDVALVPANARKRLRGLNLQPSMPFVSPTEQAIEGVLYAVNTHTGTYSIEDDATHKIRLKVPEDLRSDANLLISRRVRAVGKPDVDDAGRLTSFAVTRLNPAPDLRALHEQESFFDRHALTPVPPRSSERLDAWAIEGLSEDESSGFLAALAD
jgi:hypothetical protein